MHINIIFVCTSNVCRSPMAEGFAKKWLSQRHGVAPQDLETQCGIRVQSRGVSTNYEPIGSPASAHGIAVMRQHGVDISGHRSALLSQTDLLEATHIYCTAPYHYKAVLAIQLALKRKGICQIQVAVSTLKPEIPDPWHGTMAYFQACSGMLESGVVEALQRDLPSSE